MDPRSQPSKFVRSLVVIPVEEYEELVQLAKKRGNYDDHPYEQRSRDTVFNNIARSVRGLDQMRRESEKKRNDNDDDDDDDDDDDGAEEVQNDADERQKYVEEFRSKI